MLIVNSVWCLKDLVQSFILAVAQYILFACLLLLLLLLLLSMLGIAT